MPSFDRSDANRQALAEQIDRLLPQTQCTKCGYDGCRPYAEAIAFDGVAIDQCPPGGNDGVALLARLTGSDAREINPVHGRHMPLQVAVIDESQCIGCTLCIAACPVDAIIGAARLMHVVLSEQCSGCDLCILPCPMDCISMQPAGTPWTPERGTAARARFDGRELRQKRIEALVNAKRAARRDGPASEHLQLAASRRRAAILAAQTRARTRRDAMQSASPPKGRSDD